MIETGMRATRGELARACAWCPKPEGVAHVFMSPRDAELYAQGAKISHTTCPTCVERLLATLEG